MVYVGGPVSDNEVLFACVVLVTLILWICYLLKY